MTQPSCREEAGGKVVRSQAPNGSIRLDIETRDDHQVGTQRKSFDMGLHY